MQEITKVKPKRKIAMTIFLSIFVLFLISTSLFIVDETQAGVVTRFGKPLKTVRTPGLNFKLPWPIDKKILIDTRLLLLDIPEQSLLTYDEKNVLVNPFIVWKVFDPILFCETAQNKLYAETLLTDICAAQLANVVGQLPFNGFINLESNEVKVHEILNTATESVNEIAQKFGIKIDDVALTSFLVPNQNRMSIIDRMNAERARIAATYRSKGVEEALTIEAQAAAEHEKILGQAHADSIAIRGQGEAEALRILSEAYEKDPQFFEFIRSLESYEAIIGKQSTVFLESNSPLLKYFNGTPAQELQSSQGLSHE